MELTGKCKEDFLKWYYENHLKEDNYCKITDVEGFFKSVKPIFQNALIIDFFDSVEIFIDNELVNIDGVFTANLFHKKHRTKTGRVISGIENFKSRREAQTEAIKKANEIYNQNH